MSGITDAEKRLEQLIKQRDAMFQHLAKRYAGLDYIACEREKSAIEAVARKISAQKAALSRMRGRRV